MIKAFKQWRCKHEYHKVNEFEADIDEGVGFQLEDFVVIFCPKCDKQETVTKFRYETLMNKYVVKENFIKENEK